MRFRFRALVRKADQRPRGVPSLGWLTAGPFVPMARWRRVDHDFRNNTMLSRLTRMGDETRRSPLSEPEVLLRRTCSVSGSRNSRCSGQTRAGAIHDTHHVPRREVAFDTHNSDTSRLAVSLRDGLLSPPIHDHASSNVCCMDNPSPFPSDSL